MNTFAGPSPVGTTSTSSPSKPKHPRAAALDVARELCNAMAPFCERLIVAGSLRRRKQLVGDVEILYIPKLQHIPRLAQADLLCDLRSAICDPSSFQNLADRALDKLQSSAIILPRKNINGSAVWGPKNKLAYHVASGIPVDLFSATVDNWFNYLVCRTGSADNNTRIATAARDKNWKWNPYGAGFTDEENNLVKVESEQDVFRLLGLPYLEPWER